MSVCLLVLSLGWFCKWLKN